MKPLISIIIPLYNESESVLTLLQEISLYHSKQILNFEILLINDGSSDDTKYQILNKNNFSFPCKLISLSKNFGSHAAIRAGFLHANGDYAVYLPADLQITFDSIEKLFISSLDGYEIVIGVRTKNEISVFEKFFSNLYAGLMRKYVVKNFPNEGLETLLISRKVIGKLNENIEGNSSFALQILSLGFKNIFVPIDKQSRKQGRSKWTLSQKIKLLVDSFLAFSYAPVRLVTTLGISMLVIGLLFSAYLIFRKIIYDDLASGWPMLISILMIGFGITNISLGIIAEYLWRTLDAARKRPVFIIDEIIELNKND